LDTSICRRMACDVAFRCWITTLRRQHHKYWDDDVRNRGQPYIRSHWLNWTTVHCSSHKMFLSVKNRSIDRRAPYVSWQEIWASKASWRESLELPERGGCAGSLWYRAPRQLQRYSESMSRSLDRFADPADISASRALDRVLQRWRTPDHAQFPVLLETRVEVLCQASEQLKLSH
jgi:hypothetical protein